MTNLQKKSNNIRNNLLKQRLNTNGHLSGPLAIVDILATLYLQKMHIMKEQVESRDRFILSGYHFPALFCTLYECGFINKSLLNEMDIFNTKLIPNKDTPGFELSSYSSLGQGLSIANGIALSLILKENFLSRVYVMLGDGEMNEGQIWEALQTTIHYKLKNITIIINKNSIQLDGYTNQIKKINLFKTLKAMGFYVSRVDGHSHSLILEKLNFLEKLNKPHILICETIKGKGIDFIEKNPMEYHACQLTKDEYILTLGQLK